MLFFAGHLGDPTVSKLLALGSCSLYSPMQNFIAFTMVRKSCLNLKYVMSHLDSKMGNIFFHAPGTLPRIHHGPDRSVSRVPAVIVLPV